MDIVSASRTGKEKFYGALMLIFGALVWIVALGAVFYAWTSDDPSTKGILGVYGFYAFLFLLYRLLAPLFYRAYSFGSMIKLSPQQFPDLYRMVEDGARRVGLSKTPTAFLYNSNGLLNAFARRALGGRFVYLTSALVETQDDAQVHFVVGHELGHHAAGHLNPWLNFIKLPAHLIPFLGPAYSRARESTCDAVGMRVCSDARAAQSALAMLGCGCRRMNAGLNCDAFAAQEAEVPGFFGFLVEILSSHPRLTRRVLAIRAQSRGAAGAGAPGLNFGAAPSVGPA